MRLEVQNHQRQPILINGDDLLEDPVNDILELLERGIGHAKNGKKSEARKDLLRVTEMDSQNEDAWMWLASISDYPEELLVFLQNVLRINPENARAIQWTQSTKSLLAKTFVQRGIDSSKEDRKDFAKQCFLQAIANDDRNELAWMWLASVTENLEEKALHLNKALSINSGNETAREALASVNKLLGIPDAVEREVAATKSSKLDLALLEKAAEELACPFCEAPKFFDTIVCTSCDSLQSLDDTDALFDHTDAKREVLEKAIEKFEAEKTQRELSAIELMNLGLAYFNVKNSALGAATLEQALSKEPGNFPLETSLAMIKSRLSEITNEAKETSADSTAISETTASESQMEAEALPFVESAPISQDASAIAEVAALVSEEAGEIETKHDSEPVADTTPEVEAASLANTELESKQAEESADTSVGGETSQTEPSQTEVTTADAFGVSESETAQENLAAIVDDQSFENDSASETDAATATPVEASSNVAVVSESASEEESKPETRLAIEGDLPKTIMIVDENPTVRKLVTKKLEETGYNVLVATNGAEAIAILESVTPDLVLLDISMQHLDGYEVCKLMRETEAMKSVPVLLISEKKIRYDETKAVSFGASGHLMKPFGPGALMKTINNFLS